MKSLSHTLIGIVLTLMLVISPALAFAQDDGPGCQGLSAADCQLLHDAMAAARGLSSVSIPVWTANLYLTAEGESIFGEASGAAIVALPAELVTLRDAFIAVDTVTPDTLAAFLSEINSATVQTMLNELLLSFVVDSFELDAPGESMSGSGALIVKEGVVYLNLPAPSGENAWFGEPVVLTASDLAEIDAGLAQLRLALLEADMAEAFDAAGALLAVQQGLRALVQQHVTTTRLSDERLGDQAAAVFTSTLNLKDVLADPTLAANLLALLQDLAAQSPDMDEIPLNQQQLQLLLVALNLMLTEGTLTTSQWIGLDDGYPHRMTYDAVLNLDLSLFGSAAEDTPQGPIVMSASLALDLDDFDAVTPAQVVLPASYYPGEDLDRFLVGTPEQVETVLAVGDVINRTMPAEGDTQLFALPLEAGQTVTLTLESEGYPYLRLYDPNAFEAGALSAYVEEPLVFTAESAGVHFITVQGYSGLAYRLTVAAG